ncbi:metallophosphoesterase family protein [Helicovermis profundi]|uniref:Nuclease SbcCD subunit D n=1 Tax=Helicovermis profundi TaxID=3065157 RepID=A0AAU9E1P6_9FIRM|nr:exonuclease SbcCD subunit D [Clostridia bacterium S502]
MKLLHTSDWHLGKHLEGKSRLDEQEKFLEDLINITNKNSVDVVLISGDIFDTVNPSSKAETLYYDTVKKLSNGGERLIVIIAGNHDNPSRLDAVYPLAKELGIIIVGKPGKILETGKVGNFDVLKSDKGLVEIDIKGEKTIFALLPYPSESRLEEVFDYYFKEEDAQREYSKRIGLIMDYFDSYFREDTINIVASHLFVMGGLSTDSERPIQIGGGLLVHASDLSKKADYIALGHLHRPQRIKSEFSNIIYSGSPIQYSKSEIGYSKSVFIVDFKAGKAPVIDEIWLNTYKPIEVWKCNSITEAIEKARENSQKESYVYLEIKTDKVIELSEIKEIKNLKNDILSIVPIFSESERESEEFNTDDKDIYELFDEYYFSENMAKASQELTKMFYEIVRGDEDETDIS